MEELDLETKGPNDANNVLSAVPFTYEWWMGVGKKAYWIADNLAWHTHYWEVADYCKSRAEDCEFKRHGKYPSYIR